MVGNPGCSQLDILLSPSAKTLLSNKATFTGSGIWHIFQEPLQGLVLGLSHVSPVSGRRGHCGLLKDSVLDSADFLPAASAHSDVSSSGWGLCCSLSSLWLCTQQVLSAHRKFCLSLRALGGLQVAEEPGRGAERSEQQGAWSPAGKGRTSLAWVWEELCQVRPSPWTSSLTDRLALLPAQAHTASSMVSVRVSLCTMPLWALSCSNSSHGSPLLLSQI